MNKYWLTLLILLPFVSNGQDNQNWLGLTEKQNKLYMEALGKVRSDPKASITIYDSLLKEKPDFCQAIVGLGFAYYYDKNLPFAKYYFWKGISCYPGKPLCYNQLSVIYREEKKYDSAEYILLKYIDDQTYDLDSLRITYFELGKITRAKNQYHKSVEYLTEAINRYTDENKDLNSYAELFFLRADSYSTIDEPEKAWKDILEFEKLKPGDMRALALGGDILQDMGKYEESNRVLKDYLKNPTNLGENWVNYLIGINYHALNEKEMACKHFKIAKALGYDNPILMEYLKECE